MVADVGGATTTVSYASAYSNHRASTYCTSNRGLGSQIIPLYPNFFPGKRQGRKAIWWVTLNSRDWKDPTKAREVYGRVFLETLDRMFPIELNQIESNLCIGTWGRLRREWIYSRLISERLRSRGRIISLRQTASLQSGQAKVFRCRFLSELFRGFGKILR